MLAGVETVGWLTAASWSGIERMGGWIDGGETTGMFGTSGVERWGGWKVSHSGEGSPGL